MFQVKSKKTGAIYDIYGVQSFDSEMRDARFLSYYEGKWIWLYSEDFEPI